MCAYQLGLIEESSLQRSDLFLRNTFQGCRGSPYRNTDSVQLEQTPVLYLLIKHIIYVDHFPGKQVVCNMRHNFNDTCNITLHILFAR